MAVTFVCCYLTGLIVANLANSQYGGAVNRLFPHIGGAALDQGSISDAWSTIQGSYVLRNVPGNAGTEGSERGMVQMLRDTYHDRFTRFFTKDEYRQFSADLNGQRSGSIGIALEARCAGEKICAGSQQPTELVIESVLRNQPADRAGLRNGDVLVAVGGTRLTSLGATPDQQLPTVGSRIRGPAGTAISLAVTRQGQPLTVSVNRADLNIPSVYSQAFGPVLYLEVTGFANDTADAAREQLRRGIGAGATGVILDLRHDGGGYVTAAQSLASQFLTRSGKQQDVVVRRGRMDPSGDPTTASNVIHDQILEGGVATAPRLAVLIDGDTASAAEIVAAAIHDDGRGRLVGEKTFGKGSVQVDFTLRDGNDLHLTVEKWYGPSGESIDEHGITPDQTVALPGPDARFSLDAQSVDPLLDPQLQAALSALR